MNRSEFETALQHVDKDTLIDTLGLIYSTVACDDDDQFTEENPQSADWTASDLRNET